MDPCLAFQANTLSFLYSRDLKLREARIVPVEKLFCMAICPENMPFVYDQDRRMTRSLLDSPFLFVEKGCDGKVDAYCLSYPCWGSSPPLVSRHQNHHQHPGTHRNGISSSSSSLPVPSRMDLYVHGVMRMVQDEEDARKAFEAFCACPLAKMICEHGDDAEDQQRNAQIIDAVARPWKKQATMCSREGEEQTKWYVGGDGNHDNVSQNEALRRKEEDVEEEYRIEKQMYLAAGKDGRKAVFGMDSTLATYTERFGRGWMGQMMLESVANVHTFTSNVPMEGLDLDGLVNKRMKIQRIESIRVQRLSTLLLKRNALVALTTHRFSEKKLCKPRIEYESMGWVVNHFRR